jgi:hypothetical protein
LCLLGREANHRSELGFVIGFNLGTIVPKCVKSSAAETNRLKSNAPSSAVMSVALSLSASPTQNLDRLPPRDRIFCSPSAVNDTVITRWKHAQHSVVSVS